jgi:hypothetical protein
MYSAQALVKTLGREEKKKISQQASLWKPELQWENHFKGA